MNYMEVLESHESHESSWVIMRCSKRRSGLIGRSARHSLGFLYVPVAIVCFWFSLCLWERGMEKQPKNTYYIIIHSKQIMVPFPFHWVLFCHVFPQQNWKLIVCWSMSDSHPRHVLVYTQSLRVEQTTPDASDAFLLSDAASSAPWQIANAVDLTGA